MKKTEKMKKNINKHLYKDTLEHHTKAIQLRTHTQKKEQQYINKF